MSWVVSEFGAVRMMFERETTPAGSNEIQGLSPDPTP
jgi:hypothetical protein